MRLERPGAGSLLLLVHAAAACSAPGAVGQMRFENRPPVWIVNDRLDTPTKPHQEPFPHKLYFFDALLHRRLTHAMEMHPPVRAMNVNSLDEVPSSTWFTNRVGRREVSLEEIQRGPNTDSGPDLSSPLTVTGSKVGGKSVGILARDARGIKYILKFDEPEVPVMETATDVVLCRLLWALGYNVPENDIIYLRREDLVLSPEAKVKDTFGNARPMTVTDLERDLARVYRSPGGTFRALASRFLAGVPIGGFPQEGVRQGDPNDHVPHEHRRELRGLYVFFGWLQQTDVKEDNTLDMWVEDPADPSRRYVMHYLVDFGKALGSNAYIQKHAGDGHTEVPDAEYFAKSLLALGLWKRPFEGVPISDMEGVGVFDAGHFDPVHWKGNTPYLPFTVRDDYDMFWAAKILMALTEEQIHTAVEQGRYEDERAVDTITETLVARQQRAGRAFFSRVNPLDRFSVRNLKDQRALCCEDLLLTYELAPGAEARTTYAATAYDFDGNDLGWHEEASAAALPRGKVCFDGFPAGRTRDAYTIVSIRTRRSDRTFAPVELHLAQDPQEGALRIIGINRR